MGYEQMDVAPALEGGASGKAFEKSISLSGAGDSDSILMPDDIKSIVVTAQGASGATATIYSSTDTISVIKSGTGITWVAWGAGAISSATGAVFSSVTAIKLTQTGTGTTKLTMRCQ